MNALFNSLTRGTRYVFVFGHVDALTATFHEYMPDGTPKVSDGTVHYLNPSRVIYAREIQR